MFKRLIERIDGISLVTISKLGYVGVVLNFAGLLFVALLLLLGLPGCEAVRLPVENCMRELLP